MASSSNPHRRRIVANVMDVRAIDYIVAPDGTNISLTVVHSLSSAHV
jgi:hypothetical protein